MWLGYNKGIAGSLFENLCDIFHLLILLGIFYDVFILSTSLFQVHVLLSTLFNKSKNSFINKNSVKICCQFFWTSQNI